MRNCFIPGCDRTCRNEGKTKRIMFLPPKDKDTFLAWVRVLPKQRPLKFHDKVCERHFHEHEIVKTFDNNINGLLYKMERGRAKLRPKSVPSLNLDDTRAPPTVQRKRTTNSNIAIKENTTIQRLETDSNEIIIQSIEHFGEQQLEVDGEVQQAIISADELEITDKENEDIPIDQVTYKIDEDQVVDAQINELFESMYDDIYEVVLPNTLWGVHRCPERSSIFFSFIDPSQLRTTKLVSISSQGEIKVLLGNRLMSEQCLVSDVDSIESLTQMINEIDEIRLCLKMLENEFCEVSLKDSSSEICATCEQTGLQ